MSDKGSFIRPEAAAALKRWGEPVLWIAAGVVGFWLLVQPGWAIKLVGGCAVFVAATLFAGSLNRARRPEPAEGPGLVKITERELMYLGPESGGTVTLDGLRSVVIETSDVGPFGEDVVWVFRDDTGHELRIPNGAIGAEGLFDALSPFPGVDYDAAIRAMSSTEVARFTIWSKPPGALGRH